MAALAGFLLACAFADLLAYALHRACHEAGLFSRRHWRHHAAAAQDHWLKDALLFYGPPCIPLYLAGLLAGASFGCGWAAGGAAYTLLFAWAHHLQHARPGAAFWMRRPVHALHHEARGGRCNYGVLHPGWDLLLGTYRDPGEAR